MPPFWFSLHERHQSRGAGGDSTSVLAASTRPAEPADAIAKPYATSQYNAPLPQRHRLGGIKSPSGDPTQPDKMQKPVHSGKTCLIVAAWATMQEMHCSNRPRLARITPSEFQALAPFEPGPPWRGWPAMCSAGITGRSLFGSDWLGREGKNNWAAHGWWTAH